VAYGVFRPYPPYYRSPRPRIYSMPRSPSIFELPDPATLCNGKRLKYGFYVLNAGGIIVRATSGAEIQIGPLLSSVDGTAESSVVGDYLELQALNDTLWGAIAEVPSGNWSVT
jgi:hypothetical protein